MLLWQLLAYLKCLQQELFSSWLILPLHQFQLWAGKQKIYKSVCIYCVRIDIHVHVVFLGILHVHVHVVVLKSTCWCRHDMYILSSWEYYMYMLSSCEHYMYMYMLSSWKVHVDVDMTCTYCLLGNITCTCCLHVNITCTCTCCRLEKYMLM